MLNQFNCSTGLKSRRLIRTPLVGDEEVIFIANEPNRCARKAHIVHLVHNRVHLPARI